MSADKETIHELEVINETNVSLNFVVKGEVITSNFETFEKHVVARIHSINDVIETNEHVEQGKIDVKDLKSFVEELNAKEDEALKQMNEVNMLLQGTKRLRGFADEKRKAIEKEVKRIAAKIKQDLIDSGISSLEIKTKAFEKLVVDATYRKSSPALMKKAIDEAVESINSQIIENRELLQACKDKHGESVGYDESALLVMPTEMVVIELDRRVERQRQEKEKAELQAKLEAEKKAAADKAASQPEMALEKTVTSEIQRADTKSGNHLDKRPAVETKPSFGKEEEWDQFMMDVPAVFLQFRELRLALDHAENQKRALKMAEAVNDAFQEMKKGN